MKNTIVGLLVVSFLFCIFVSLSFATISPTTLTATLNLGESISETKTVDLPAKIPIGDIIFAFDLTGSMGGEIETAKVEAINIMSSLDALISDAQYGVMSYMDYPYSYDSYGYNATYGGGYDYPYLLDQPLTSNRTAVSDAITGLSLGGGADGPQCYTRIMYESYADPAIGWRFGSKRILLNFGDNVPHDDNLDEGVPGKTGNWTTGGDPGRDEEMFTDDDLDLQMVLAEMTSNHVTLLEIHSRGYAFEYWEYWTSITGGTTFDLASPAGIPDAIVTVIGEEAAFVSTLTLETTPEYESWLTSVTPPSYTDLELPTIVTFDVEVTVPIGTSGGTYTFEIMAVGDGASYGEQLVTITVPVPDATKPIAKAGIDQTVVEDTVVSFDAEGSSDNVGIVSYEWDFGDGTPKVVEDDPITTHTYAEPGTYIVTLTVRDATGNESTHSITITVLLTEVTREPRSAYIVAEVAVVGAAVTAATAAVASFGGLGQSFNSAVSKLPIPDKLKDFLQLYGEAVFETVDKAKLEALEKAPFITRGELAALGASALIMTTVFGYVEANGLPRFLDPSVLAAVIPSTLLSVCMVSVAGELSEAFCARTCRVYRQYRLWMYGLGVLLISGLLFLFPFASPGITRYQSGEISNKTKGLIVLSKMLLLLTLAIPFAGLFMLGFKIIGDAGLLFTLMIVCYSLLPLKPLVGKAVFDYRKEVSLIAFVSAGILFYSCIVNLLPHVTYLAAGVVSVFLAAITLSQLRKTHPK